MFIWHSLYIEQPGEFFIYKFIWHSLEIQQPGEFFIYKFIWHSLEIQQPGEFFIYKFIWHSLEIQHYSLIILHIEEIHHAFNIHARVRKLSCYFFLGSFDIFKCSTFGMITYIDVYLPFIRDSTAQIIVHINVHSTFLWDPTVWIIT